MRFLFSAFGGQVTNEFAVFVREKSFMSEDSFDYGPYISSIQKIYGI